jgi:osmotically-inducible protein OsmY
MYRKFALFAVTLSVFSVVLMGCPKAEEAATDTTAAAGDKMAAAGDKMAAAGDKMADAGGKMAAAGDKMADAGSKMAAGAIDTEAITKTINAVPGLEGVNVVKNDKGELALTGTVANQELKVKAEELAKTAGITTLMNKIITK